MALKWDSQLVTGIEDVDEQHQNLVAIINRLEETVKYHEGAGVISETVEELNKYVYDHFRTEESIMHSYAYPHIDKHLNEHNYFKKKMIRFNFRPDAQESSPDIVLSFLQYWLVNHICTADKELGAFIQESFQG